MPWQELSTSGDTPLDVGRYDLQLQVPDALLNAFRAHPGWAQIAAQKVASQYGADVVFNGGGVANLSTGQQVLEVQFHVVTIPSGGGGSSGMSPQQVVILLVLGGIIAVLGLVLGIESNHLLPVAFRKWLAGDGNGDGGGGDSGGGGFWETLRDFTSGFKYLGIAAIIVGGFLVLHQLGIGKK